MPGTESLPELLRGHEAPWPLFERTVGELWVATERIIHAVLEERGAPSMLRSVVESGAELIDPAQLDPYSVPTRFLEDVTALAADGWLEPVGDGRFRVAERAEEVVTAAIAAGDAHLEALGLLPAADLERHAAVLGRVIGRRADERSSRRARALAAPSSAAGRVRANTRELSMQRSEAHRAAWDRIGISARTWNAFTFIWRGDARNAVEVAALQAPRGYTAADYKVSVDELVELGWLEPDVVGGRFRPSVDGTALRDDVELRTDLTFYRLFASLTDAEFAELVERQAALRARLREVRRSAREAAVDRPPR